MKPILIVCATSLSRAKFHEAPISYYLKKIGYEIPAKNINYEVVYNNKLGLPEVYNQFLVEENRDKNILFVHDDVNIQDAFLQEKLEIAFETADIIGLAGAKFIKTTSPALWHLMSDRTTWSGAVAHLYPDETIGMSSFGPMPKRVLVLDGLFLAVNTEKILDAGLKFSEEFEFHFYDLDFCLTANQLRLKLSTCPIWVIHSGLGDSFQSNEWKRLEPIFLSKWGGK